MKPIIVVQLLLAVSAVQIGNGKNECICTPFVQPICCQEKKEVNVDTTKQTALKRFKKQEEDLKEIGKEIKGNDPESKKIRAAMKHAMEIK